MGLDLTIRLDNIWQRVGRPVRAGVYRDSLRPSVVDSPQYGLILHRAKTLRWPQGDAFVPVSAEHLSVRAWHGENRSAEFKRGEPALREVCSALGVDWRSMIDTEFLRDNLVLAALVSRTAPLTLEFAVDTDDDTFCALAQSLTESGQDFAESVGVIAFDSVNSESGSVRLLLSPAGVPPDFDGYVALDLGNTASTIAVLPLGTDRTRDIRVLDADNDPGELRPDADPVVSQVRLDEAAGLSDSPNSARWVIGRTAATKTDGLITGVKRMLAGRDWEAAPPTMIAGKPIPLTNRVPAELLMCRMFQRLREATFRQPKNIALTYPTTYAPKELDRLRQTAYRGWLRMRARKQDNDKVALNSRQRLSFALDEASAAAFFFLYRRIFEAPGGLPRFRYLYPEGLNMLIFDCGGGTTDIAVVRALCRRDMPLKMRIDVLARGGLRGFGGDNMTMAAARVLKAKLAAKMAEVRGLPGRPVFPAAGADARAINEFLDRNAKLFDDLVPTRFRPDNLDDDNRRRRNHALALWGWAEDVKRRLSATPGKPANFVFAPFASELGRFLAGSESEAAKVKAALDRVTLDRAELDPLIEPALLAGVQTCNRLLRRELTGQDQELHWVVAGGNASRYPLVPELLKKHLAVPFLEAPAGASAPASSRLTLDPDNLKHACAKGAVLAMAMRLSTGLVQVEFAGDLANRLPFDVACREAHRNRYRVLFAEGSPYAGLAAQRVATSSPSTPAREAESEGQPTEWFHLQRRWPGDEESAFHPFLRFHFPGGLSGPLMVKYDAELHQFSVEDAQGRLGAAHEEAEAGLDRSPTQRGDW